MEPIIINQSIKPSYLRNILVRLFLTFILIIALRFAYIITIRGESCDVGDFCFFSSPDVTVNAGQLSITTASSSVISSSVHHSPSTPKKLPDLWSTDSFQTAANFYSAIFQDLISDAILSPSFKTLCLDTQTGADVYALKEIGVEDSIGSFKKAVKPLVVGIEIGIGVYRLPFLDESLDFVFSGNGGLERFVRPGLVVDEIDRVLKVNGYFVVHTGTKDGYSYESLMRLFGFCRVVKTREVHGFDSRMKSVKEIVLQKIGGERGKGDDDKNCSVSGFKWNLVKKAEPLIKEEPLKPWITLKKNAQTMIKYLPSLVDISFKSRYVYVDVGARSYGSSIVSWFKKQYPKQNKTFDVYAIEADKTFYDDYKSKKGVTLLPYAAWVRNESLFFEINEDPGHTHKEVEKGRGMGRIQPVQGSKGSTSSGGVDEIKGFDFADWLKNTVSETDYVVMKMDVEGTEFDLIPRLFETGAICLIDELFLECHYNRWQRCCPGERSTKYQKTYGQCLDLFTSLRKAGVLVHQWW